MASHTFKGSNNTLCFTVYREAVNHRASLDDNFVMKCLLLLLLEPSVCTDVVKISNFNVEFYSEYTQLHLNLCLYKALNERKCPKQNKLLSHPSMLHKCKSVDE